jgi:hypothetical protein
MPLYTVTTQARVLSGGARTTQAAEQEYARQATCLAILMILG